MKNLKQLIGNNKKATTVFIAIFLLVLCGGFSLFLWNITIPADSPTQEPDAKKSISEISETTISQDTISLPTSTQTDSAEKDTEVQKVQSSTANITPQSPSSEIKEATPQKDQSPATTGTSNKTANTSSHQHTWVDHTTQVWVPNLVTIVDQPEQKIYGAQLYTEQADGTWLSNGELYWFENGFTMEDFESIIVDKMLNENYIGNWVNRSKTIPAVTHQEDQGHYENVVDYQYCESCGQQK